MSEPTEAAVPRRLLPGSEAALRVRDLLIRLEDIATVVVVAVLFVLIFLQVVARYLVSAPLYWIEEVARTGMVWLTFLAAALVTAKLAHLAVTNVADAVGRRARRVMLIAAESAALLVSIALIPASWHVVESVMGVMGTSEVFPRSALFLGPLIGFALMALHSVINLLWTDLEPTSNPEAEL